MFPRILILIMLVVTACTPNPIQNSNLPQNSVKNTKEASLDITAIPSPVAKEGLQKKLSQIVKSDLATRLNVDMESIGVILIESIVWPNAALGCPLPDEVYAEGTVPGFRVRLEANEQEYEYHMDEAGNFILCLDEKLPSFPVTPGEIDDGQPWMPVN